MLLFIDFDGVTHPRVGGMPFSASCMEALSQAIQGAYIEIVIASSWREEMNFGELQELLHQLGKPVIAVTPVIDDPFTQHVRYQEVLKYLQESEQQYEKWMAIDDTRGFYPAHAPVFLTDPLTGFTHDDIPGLQKMISAIN